MAQTIGSSNTATADPAVARPATVPCAVQLFSNQAFADFSPKPFTYAPPAACPGPWAKVVLEADFAVTAGRQFDRTAQIALGARQHLLRHYGGALRCRQPLLARGARPHRLQPAVPDRADG